MKQFASYSRSLPWLLALLVSALLAACGGGQDPILGGADVARAGPTVTHTTPATTRPGPTLNVPVNTAIRATFNEDMAPATLTAGSTFTLTGPGATPVAGALVPVTYASRIATFHPAKALVVGETYTATITTAAKNLAGNALASNYVWTFKTVADTTLPTVTLVNPANGDLGVCLQKTVTAAFSEAMDSTTLNSSPAGTLPTFTLNGGGVSGTVAMNATNKIATFTPTANLLDNTDYTATITTFAKDLAGNPLAANKVWTFRTGTLPCATPAPVAAIDLGMAARFGTFGGTAGMTNTGNQTVITGSGGTPADIGTIATETSTVTGFHDSTPDFYTEVPGVNVGNVTGKIYTCTNSTTGPTSAVNPVSCGIATEALADARAAYLVLEGMPVTGVAAPANLKNVTLNPGVYKAPSGSFMIQGGNLTLDAQGDSSAIFVFQMASTLTVGGPGAAFPQSIILDGGAQAKNVFWQVGSSAIINAAGDGTMVGTIISQAGAVFSTAGRVVPVNLNGRAVSLGASVTMVNTIITVPAP